MRRRHDFTNTYAPALTIGLAIGVSAFALMGCASAHDDASAANVAAVDREGDGGDQDASPDCTDVDRIEASACGSCGAQYRSCSPDPNTGHGHWTEWTSCGGEAYSGDVPVCELRPERCNQVDAVEARACGRCGTTSRACLQSAEPGVLEWGAWGPCTGELPAGEPLPASCSAQPH